MVTKPKNSQSKVLKGLEPEALAKFAQVARNRHGQPVRDGMEAKPVTSAIPTDPGLKQDAANKVLREGVYHTDQGAKEAIDRLPDRTAKGTGRGEHTSAGRKWYSPMRIVEKLYRKTRS
jgi:hypothetical protein